MNSARDVDYLTELEKQVIVEMNRVRTNPSRYAEEYIRPKLAYFNGTEYAVPGEIVRITAEGRGAVEECLEVLGKATEAMVLEPSPGLSRSARDHAKDQGRSGGTGHEGSDRSTFQSRVERYGTWGLLIGESIDYGNETAREIVLSLLIDDGVPSRKHRTIMLDPRFRTVGVALGQHPECRAVCVIDYAGRYTDTSARR
jgi:hypothetical protein